MDAYKILIVLLAAIVLTGCIEPGNYLGGLVRVDTMDRKGNITSSNHATPKSKPKFTSKEIDLSYLRYNTFLYHDFAKAERSDYVLQSIASAYYPEYRQERNEFERKRILEKITPEIVKNIDFAKSLNTVLVEHQAHLSEYDFKNKIFTYHLPFEKHFQFNIMNQPTNQYVINYEKIYTDQTLPMNEREAESFVKSNGRVINLLLSVEIKPSGRFTLSGKIKAQKVLGIDGSLLKSAQL